MKKKVHDLLEVSPKKGTASYYVDLFIITLILLNAAAIIMESVAEYGVPYHDLFRQFELFSIIVFTIEYILRVWSANADERYKKPFYGNLEYAKTPLAIIDLFAVLPFYIVSFGVDLRFVRVMRLFRLFKLFKIVRYLNALNHINEVVKEKREELTISIVFTMFLLVIASTLMYYVEHDAQPEVFSSIPMTMWWSISTLTTVGYGDVYPITAFGKIFGGVIAILGIGLFALPTGILASGFSEQIANKKNKKKKKDLVCPHCHKDIIR